MDESSPDRPTRPRTLLGVWAALVALAGLSAWAATLHLGGVGTAVALAAATAKAALVVWFFMGLREEGAAFRVFFLLGVAVVLLILGLTFLDLAYR